MVGEVMACPECGGDGCKACRNRGIVRAVPKPDDEMAATLRGARDEVASGKLPDAVKPTPTRGRNLRPSKRRSISLKGLTYQRLETYLKSREGSMSGTLEVWIAEALADK